MNLNYDKTYELTGVMSVQSGMDCCTDGKEQLTTYPALLLDEPVNVSAINPANPDGDDPRESDVKMMQIAAMEDGLFEKIKHLKDERVKISCNLFHSMSGHHMTPVLCGAYSIAPAYRPSKDDAIKNSPGNLSLKDVAIVLGVAFLALTIYFYPVITAINKKHPDVASLFVVNLLFGWTFIGWGLALAWAYKRYQKT